VLARRARAANENPRMKFTKRQVEDLQTLMRHSAEDIDYGAGGTFNCDENGERGGDEYDKKAAESAKRAIFLIADIITGKKK
jgi:hypothetical protein